MPSYKPHPKQAEVHNAKQKRIILNWGRQTGKTLFAVNYAWIEAVKTQGRYFIVFPTYQQSYDAMFSQYISYIPKQLIKEIDKSRLIIRLHHIKGKMKLPDGTEIQIDHDEDSPPSTIELKGSDTTTADRLRGSRVHGIIFDEFAYQDPGKWERVFEPMLSTTNGFAMFISSPQGYNHFYDQWMYAQKHPDRWFSSHATGYDNPLVTDEFLEEKKKEAQENDNLLTFQQEYMAEFKQRSGLVYSVFDRNVHIFKPQEMPKTGTRLLGLDWGFEHPFAAVFVLVDHEENWWIYDEVYIRKKTPDVWLELVKNKIGNDHITIAAADSAGPEHIALFSKNGIPIIPVKKVKSSIRDGIQLIRQRMMPREQLNGPPRPKLKVSTNCPNLIMELENYVYPEGNSTKDGKTKEDPIKEWDDALDALRYIALTQQNSLKQDYSAFEASSIYNGDTPWSI